MVSINNRTMLLEVTDIEVVVDIETRLFIHNISSTIVRSRASRVLNWDFHQGREECYE